MNEHELHRLHQTLERIEQSLQRQEQRQALMDKVLYDLLREILQGVRPHTYHPTVGGTITVT